MREPTRGAQEVSVYNSKRAFISSESLGIAHTLFKRDTRSPNLPIFFILRAILLLKQKKINEFQLYSVGNTLECCIKMINLYLKAMLNFVKLLFLFYDWTRFSEE